MKVKVTDYGVVIPKKLNFITIIPKAKQDPILKLGVNHVSCSAADASENLDKYIYIDINPNL